jgi:SAM-dependent methyltransferase
MIKTFKELTESVVEAPAISNMNTYLSGMRKGIESKLFFLEKINPDCIVDFGCADGYLLETIKKLKPNIKLVGYDIDTRMINILKKKKSNIHFTSDWEKVKDIISEFKSPALILSSVIHEVYSYGSSSDIRNFWQNKVFTNSFKYIVIRDMIPSIKHMKYIPIYVNKIREKSDPIKLKSFEDHWGKINNSRTLLHWLLKYPYTENWNRELYENYLPITIEELYSKIPSNWIKRYNKFYTYSYIKERIKRDFDVDLELPTHLKLILENTSKN